MKCVENKVHVRIATIFDTLNRNKLLCNQNNYVCLVSYTPDDFHSQDLN